MADRVGEQLGNYQLIRLLGRGGFAEVYLGEHLRLGTQAAIKVLYTRLASKDAVEEFEKEARTVAHLKHPHIVRVLDYDVEDDTPFLVMDFASGGTLRKRHPRGTILSLTTIISYIKQVADALQYAHDQRVIHRDVKPENMLVREHDELLLSDFGIAIAAQSSRYQSTQNMGGTIAYIAPEQIQGHPRTASDQYSLGIVVYEWLSGNCPFHGSMTEIVAQHLAVSPQPLREKVPAISPDVEQVVTTALAKDPKRRFGSMLAFAAALEQASQVKQTEPELGPVIPILETTGTHQSQKPTEMTTPVPVIPFSQQAVSEVSADTPAQSQTIPPLSGKERLRQIEKETRQAEEESAHQEKEQADKLEEERVRKAKDRVLTTTGLSTAAPQTALPTEVAHASKLPALRPEAMAAVKPAKPGILRRFVLLVLAGLVIVVLVSGIAWLTVHHAFPAGSISSSGTVTEFPIPTANSAPYAITAGPDGNLWFTETGSGKIGRISPSGTVTEFPIPTTDSSTNGITVGADGNLWFTDYDGNKIGRISPSK